MDKKKPTDISKVEPNAVGRGAYGTFNTKKDRYNFRKKMKEQDPSRSFIPPFNGLEGLMHVRLRQQVVNVTGPVYTTEQLIKLEQDLRKSGRIVPKFHQIQKGDNAGKWRQIETAKPSRWITHKKY